MNPAAIPQMLTQLVPFIRTVGLTIDEAAPGRARASLKSRPEVHNHLGTVHAGALYTVGESATGAVVLGLFGDRLPSGAFIALKTGQVAHQKAREGDLSAEATLEGDPAAIREAFEASGKVDFLVNVSFTVGGDEVATATYAWAVRRPRA